MDFLGHLKNGEFNIVFLPLYAECNWLKTILFVNVSLLDTVFLHSIFYMKYFIENWINITFAELHLFSNDMYSNYPKHRATACRGYTKDYFHSMVNFAPDVSVPVVKSEIYAWEGGISRAETNANIKLLDRLPRRGRREVEPRDPSRTPLVVWSHSNPHASGRHCSFQGPL